MASFKNYLRKLLPDGLVRYLYGNVLHNYLLYKAASYDRRRFKKYSDNFLMNSKVSLIGNIIKHYHVVEKGLTMPEPRLGFGQANLAKLIKECQKYVELFGNDDSQLQHALAVLLEYKEYHQENDYNLDERLIQDIDALVAVKQGTIHAAQKKSTKEDYFIDAKEPFDVFCKSRSSLRNFSTQEIKMSAIRDALDLARTTPSACNRQSWRAYTFEDKQKISEILAIQGGNRGFGHLTNKLIVITGELGVYGHSFERNQVFIDGGMYAMNLLYALHFKEIGACILNCSTSPEKDAVLHRLCEVNKSEVFIAMIACGIPAESFKVPVSPRYELDKVAKF